MTDWQGDWGFEPAVMEMLDNAMPPYLIRFESFSALPFTASVGPADTAPSAYELLKLEIEYYIRNYFEGKDSSPSDDELNHIPTDEEIRHQARWVLYDDDDPWNQTPADVEEWLLKFKKDVGLA
ncbi:Homeobox protein 4 [Colletotrichum sp. SAR 10_75]|nr:Homeobox protein 4 [Colletotrichum sp. SAR 10_75]